MRGEDEVDRNAPFGSLPFHRLHEDVVAVALQFQSALEPFQLPRGLKEIERPEVLLLQRLRAVDGDSADFLVVGEVGEPVAVCKGDAGERPHDEALLFNALNPADGLPRMLGALELSELVGGVKFAAVNEVVGLSAVEDLVGRRRKGIGAYALGSAGELWSAPDDGVDFFAVEGRDVLHVRHVLQAPLDLEGGDARVDERLEVRALVVVLE